MYKTIPFWICFLFVLGCARTGHEEEGEAEAGSTEQETVQDTVKKVIVFFGNSLTAGYGLKLSEAYPAIIQAKIDSAGLACVTINAGVSGETSASGNSRVDWVLESPVDVFFLELGGNDGLRGIPVAETYKNLQSIIGKVKAKYPDAKIILAGMQVPPNMGQKYTREFAAIYPELAAKNEIYLVPFLLEGVGGERHLNLSDGIHPTAEGHRIVAENVWKVMEEVLRSPEE